MADAKKDDHHGHAYHPPGWLVTAIIVIVLLVIGNWLLQGFIDTINPNRSALVDLRSQRDAALEELRRERIGLGGGGSTRTTTGGGTGYRGHGVPSPEEIARRVPHKRTRTAVPCIAGYVKDDVTGQCDLVEWTPGPEPE